MLLKISHLAILVASGMKGILYLTGDDGHLMLVKGRVVKVAGAGSFHRYPGELTTG